MPADDPSLVARQADVAKTMPESKAFMGGDAYIGLRVDTEVYENARLANLEECGGENIWDDPEYRADMARRHPELMSPYKGKSFNMNTQSYGGKLKAKNRFGRVKSRSRWRGHLKITDRFEDGVRTVRNIHTGLEKMYDLETGAEL